MFNDMIEVRRRSRSCGLVGLPQYAGMPWDLARKPEIFLFAYPNLSCLLCRKLSNEFEMVNKFGLHNTLKLPGVTLTLRGHELQMNFQDMGMHRHKAQGAFGT